MVLVDYSDSDSDEIATTTTDLLQDKAASSKKRKLEDGTTSSTSTSTNRYPPSLPSTFHSLYATNVRTSTADDPSLHGGRKRQIVHVTGNWPSHIYLEWLPDKVQLKHLDDIVDKVQQLISPVSTSSDGTHGTRLASFLRSPLSAQLPLHISLSAPLVLSTSTKDDFQDRLSKAVTDAKIGKIGVRLESLDLVPNFERSRWFLITRVKDVSSTDRALGDLLDVCNEVCEELGLSTLYQRGDGIGVAVDNEKQSSREGTRSNIAVGAFHISVAWMLDEVEEGIRNEVTQIPLGELGLMEVEFNYAKVKIGNTVHDIPL